MNSSDESREVAAELGGLYLWSILMIQKEKNRFVSFKNLSPSKFRKETKKYQVTEGKNHHSVT